jgi:hypothetical protein
MVQWVGAGSAEHGVGKTTRPDCTLDTNPPKAKSQKPKAKRLRKSQRFCAARSNSHQGVGRFRPSHRSVQVLSDLSLLELLGNRGFSGAATQPGAVLWV